MFIVTLVGTRSQPKAMALFLPLWSLILEKLSPTIHTEVMGWRVIREGILEEVLADVSLGG